MFRLLFGLHAFTGIGAIVGGLACIFNPQNPLGAPVEILKNSPFSNFLIPGIILFTVLGLGNIIGSVAIYCKSKFRGCISNVLGWALIIWIIVQCIMINGVHFLHIAFLTIGLVEVILSAVLIFKKCLFPANIIFNAYNKLKSERTI